MLKSTWLIIKGVFLTIFFAWVYMDKFNEKCDREKISQALRQYRLNNDHIMTGLQIDEFKKVYALNEEKLQQADLPPFWPVIKRLFQDD